MSATLTVPAPTRLAALSFETDLGWMAVGSDGRRVHWLRFGYRTRRRLQAACARADTQDRDWNSREAVWVDHLQRYAAGDRVRLSDVPIQLPRCTSFQKAVLVACRNLSWGETCTYGELAERVGYPGAARAVGTVMSRNLLPLLIPCHRVLSRSGWGGYSAPQGLAMKRRLLDLEGAILDREL